MSRRRRDVPEVTGPVVPLERARAFVLNKQGLAGYRLPDVMAAVRANAGLYSTAPTCYLACVARVHDFRVADLDRELYQRRSLACLRSMRQSVYMVPVEWLQVVVGATGGRVSAAAERLISGSGLTLESYAALAERIESILERKPSQTVAEIRAELGEIEGRSEALQYVVALMSRQTRLVRAEVRGGWTSKIYTYARWADWLGQPLPDLNPSAARAELARIYFAAYGPAEANDLKWWAGWTMRETKEAIAALGDELAAVTLADGDRHLPSLLPAAQLAPLQATDPAAAHGVRLLPIWDAYLMGYGSGVEARRRFLAPEHYPLVYDASGNGTTTLLIDGMVEGVWEFDFSPKQAGLVVRVAPFTPGPHPRWPEIEAEAERIATAISATNLRVEQAPPTRSLAEGTRNTFLAPIRLGRKA